MKVTHKKLEKNKNYPSKNQWCNNRLQKNLKKQDFYAHCVSISIMLIYSFLGNNNQYVPTKAPKGAAATHQKKVCINFVSKCYHY